MQSPAPKVVPTGYELSQDYIPTGYPRPKSASPSRFSLVPAFVQCASPNRQHGPPLAFGSCNPPQQASGQLTVGTPNPTSPPANSVGSVRYRVLVGDVAVAMSITDVRNKNDLSDYTGQLQVSAAARITDRHDGPSLSQTTQDTPLPVTVDVRNDHGHIDRQRMLGVDDATTPSCPAQSWPASGRSGSWDRSRSTTAARTGSRRRVRTRSSHARASSFRDLSRRCSAGRQGATVRRQPARIAQSVEHFHGKEGVVGSSPTPGLLRNPTAAGFSYVDGSKLRD